MFMKNKNGFTLVELLIVMTIIAILVVMLIGIINPIALVNKGRDAQTKKDLTRIRIAFEEYYSDKECFPNQIIVDSLMNSTNCGKSVFSPWLNRWLCGSGDIPYKIVVEGSDCPQWYKIMSNLRNKKDEDIPADWYSVNRNITGGYTNLEVNYGVSSQNISWSD